MPNIKSAVKRVRTSAENERRNAAVKSKIHTVAKQFDASIAAGNKTEAMNMFSKYAAVVDNTSKKGIIKANTASRTKSRAAKKLAAMK